MHVVQIPSADRYSEEDPRPGWFLAAFMRVELEPRLHHEETWIWKWNRMFKPKVRWRSGQVYVVFESEADMTLFALQVA